MALIKCSYFGN